MSQQWNMFLLLPLNESTRGSKVSSNINQMHRRACLPYLEDVSFRPTTCFIIVMVFSKYPSPSLLWPVVKRLPIYKQICSMDPRLPGIKISYTNCLHDLHSQQKQKDIYLIRSDWICPGYEKPLLTSRAALFFLSIKVTLIES